jgi:NADPH:quinone reductase-like Zn-dependent oxidoreductase
VAKTSGEVGVKVQTKAELSLQTRMPVRKSFPLPTTMNAVIWTEYGPASALKMGNIEVPQPSADQILVRVFASSVASGDVKMRAFDVPAIFWLPMRLMLGLFRPRRQVPGMEFCGEVVSVGSNAPNFRTGDQVFGMVGQGGAHAEYLVVGASEAACIRPSKLDAVEAAVVPFGALSALCALRDFAQVQAGERIAIYGGTAGQAFWGPCYGNLQQPKH